MNKSDAVLKMNYFGSRKIPFLFIIDFEMKHSHVVQLDEVNNSEIFYNINGITNHPDGVKLKKKISFTKKPVAFHQYKKAYEEVIHNLEAGNTYLLNLTFPANIFTNLTLEEIYKSSFAKHKLYFKNKFVVFSPETFIQIDGRIISSNPMKGTIDASLPHAKGMILSNEKELAEHNTIVDLIRNDLSIVAKKVKVEKFRYIDEIKTNEKNLLQVSSKISGILPKDYHKQIGDIIFSLLPAGSISGAPKKKTIEIIKNVENYKRGFYTGIFGYFNGNKLDSSVMIRFIEKRNSKLIYKSGGGITAMSDVKSEYKELIDKIYVPFV